MIKLLIFLFGAFVGVTFTQLMSNVHLVGHTAYMINVINEVAQELERREWCNLKVPDITNAINETVLDTHYEGTVTYANGFVARIQHIDIRQSGVNQIWSWSNADVAATVLVRGTMRMTDLTLGYDVMVDFVEERHRYTVTITVPLVLFTFNIRKNVHTEAVQVEVEGTISLSATMNTVKFLPTDNTTDVLAALLNVQMPEDGILAWGGEVFAPITLDVYHRLEFPTICYDCPLAETMK